MTIGHDLLVFKVDFEKAFDSVRWDFLDAVMEKIGFGTKWRSWISGCLHNARSSILVNGSPTKEFELHKGLRQGDPLSLFLFILAMEGLHSLTYDVIFFGECKVLGVGVSDTEISQMASIIGRGASKFPFKYLGVPVGCNMSRCVIWNAVVLGNLLTYFMSIYLMHVSIRSKLESMRSKFFRGADLNESKMSWVKWEKCLSSKKRGGLRIGSIYGLNIGLLFKWIWRFLTRPSDLWATIIRSIRGHNGGVFGNLNRRRKHSAWGLILSSINCLKDKGIDLLSLCFRKIGNGDTIRFWEDIWCGNAPLRTQFSRVFYLDTDRNGSIANRVSSSNFNWSNILRCDPRGGVDSSQFEALKLAIGNVVLTHQPDSWQWSPDVAVGYSVSSARALVDDNLLVAGSERTRWNRHIPIKVNVFLWRLYLNKLPSRVNLNKKGIKVDSTLCPTCGLDVETLNHIFFNCEMAKDLWLLLAKWWDLDVPFCDNISNWYEWLNDVRVTTKSRLILESVGGTLCGPFGTFGTN
nr:RNA-directed DNA polymerase, eukaryota, reverse transcriptase zinc-binding domain protein [Tanacetum cinerariifolium]